MNGSQGSRRRQEHLRMHEPDDRQQMQGVLKASPVMIAEGCICVRDKGTNADHMGPEGMHEIQVIKQVPDRLEGTSDHHPASHLKTDVSEVFQAPDTVFDRQFSRMEPAVMFRVDGLVTKKISLRAGCKKGFITAARLLSYGQGHRTVRMSFPDPGNKGTNPLVCIKRILSSLQDDRPEAELIPFFTAVQDFLI